MEYILKASAVIAIFYVVYKLFLQRETFFQSNRGYLLVGLITALIIPLIVIPIYVEYTPKPVDKLWSYTLSSEVVEPQNNASFDWLSLIGNIYITGALFFFIKLLVELTSLRFLFSSHHYFKKDPYVFIETTKDIPPFSFFNWIVYNPEKYTQNELEHILNHEKAHARDLHSIDIMGAQLACIVLWFNPFVWLYKKEIQQNLEFIADKKAQEFSACEKSYQLILLKSSIPQHKFLITNNFYNSQIKKRIIMLHKSKSKKINIWKYGLILPLLAIFLMSFSTKKVFIEKEQPESMANIPQNEASEALDSFYTTVDPKTSSDALAQTSIKGKAKNNTRINSATKQSVTKDNIDKALGNISITIIDKNTSDTELKDIKEDLQKEGLKLKFKGVKRNNDGEIIAIKIDAKSKNSSANYNIDSKEAIHPIKIVYDTENDSISIGNGHAKHANNAYVYKTTEDGQYKIRKSGKGNNVFVFSETHEGMHDDDAHDAKVIIKQKGKDGKVKTIKRTKNVEVISGDEDTVEIIVEEEGDRTPIEVIIEEEEEGDTDEKIIIVNGKRIKTTGHTNVEEDVIVEKKGKKVWVTKADDTMEKDMIFIGDEDNKNSVYVSGFNGKDPLFVVDGKEVSKEEFKALGLDPKKIDSITVLKDENAREKYGDKGKNGVIIIKTKKN